MVDPLSYFSFQPVLHDWCNKGCGMCYPVCGMMHIKEPLLLIERSSPCGGSGFPLSLSEWSCLLYTSIDSHEESKGPIPNYIAWVCLTLNAYVHLFTIYSMSMFNFSLLYTSIDSHEESKGPIPNYIQWVCLTSVCCTRPLTPMRNRKVPFSTIFNECV